MTATRKTKADNPQ